MKSKASIEIRRPIADVFAYIADVGSMPRWVTGVKDTQMLSPEMGVGAHYIVEYSGGWRTLELEAEVTAYDPPHVFSTEMARGPFAFEGTFRLEPTAEGTLVTSDVEAGEESLSTRVVMVLFGAIIRRSMKRRLLTELHALETSMHGTSPTAEV